ncbi:putative amino-acid permease [Fusarium oxysporum f. sp. rapae]|uniref:Putative amino-acid permease n=1 Tax=Fusarium oxysporum f. sp. rapae TaxID=485398 RepID=A0A8J5P8R9_FUSOX|nr:putative amino-acid permease [Fusarium oxysporum f. sp. rapae]
MGSLTIAKFCSSMPVNGTNYWWTVALAPLSISRPLSFIAGMASIMNAITSIASFSWASSSSICTTIGLFTGWVPANPIIFAVAIVTCAAWFFTVSVMMDKASLVFIALVTETLVLVSSACFVIGLPVAQRTQGIPFTSVATVFGDYTNYSDWGKLVTVPFTFFCTTWVITGWNTPSAMAEENHNARIAAPRSIINTYCLQAGMGMLFCTLLAFCILEIEAVASDSTGYAAFTLLIYHRGLKFAGAFLPIIFLNTSIGGAGRSCS